jgi:hypothetical protein
MSFAASRRWVSWGVTRMKRPSSLNLVHVELTWLVEENNALRDQFEQLDQYPAALGVSPVDRGHHCRGFATGHALTARPGYACGLHPLPGRCNLRRKSCSQQAAPSSTTEPGGTAHSEPSVILDQV